MLLLKVMMMMTTTEEAIDQAARVAFVIGAVVVDIFIGA